MLKNKKKTIIISLIAIMLSTSVIFYIAYKNNTVEALSKYGSRGNEVTQIQTKLKRWDITMEMLTEFLEHKH